ncbi:hypothetical protein JHK82_034928 [Glycine max]|nr:hypothetical protein JHK85_035637 [Glycine max]KAG5111659.1 hypothetical protein JHK82_034928 [Glycine max]KAG5128949.1 hypothetical protein JHK84_035346 [Glycine max]
MGKSKGQKTTPNQPALVGGAVAAGNASIPSIAVVTGSEGESQGVRVSCSNTKTNTAHQVFGKMSKPSCAAVVGSGKEPISSTTVVVGVAGEGQGAHASSSTTAHQVFYNRPKTKAVLSPEDSYTLGEDDTSSDEESSSSSDSELVPPTANTEAAKPWVNLFKDNRKPSKGFGLQFSPPSAEEVLLDDSDLQPLEEAWGHSLIGYVAGRFPGKKALMECCQKWGVNFSYSTHESGWLVFRFQNEEDMNQVISAGPYFIFQRPLLLKVMPPFFDFGNEELSKIPVWVKLRNLPLELPTFCKHCKMIGHRLANCKAVPGAKADPALVSTPVVQSQVVGPTDLDVTKILNSSGTQKVVQPNQPAASIHISSGTQKDDQPNQLVAPHVQQSQGAIFVPVHKHSSVLKGAGGARYEPDEEGFIQVKTKTQKKIKKVPSQKPARVDEMQLDAKTGRLQKSGSRKGEASSHPQL